MSEATLQTARTYIAKNKYLNWYSNPQKLDAESIVESVLNYGDWVDFQYIKDLFGIKITYQIYKQIRNKTRTNLKERTINYFDLYFSKHA